MFNNEEIPAMKKASSKLTQASTKKPKNEKNFFGSKEFMDAIKKKKDALK